MKCISTRYKLVQHAFPSCVERANNYKKKQKQKKNLREWDVNKDTMNITKQHSGPPSPPFPLFLPSYPY